jgi:hypothetical protein
VTAVANDTQDDLPGSAGGDDDLPSGVQGEEIPAPPPPPPPLGMQTTDVWVGETPPIHFVCQALHLAPGRPTCIVGFPGCGKTVLAGEIGLSVAEPDDSTRGAWGGLPIDRRGKVLLIDLEVGEIMTRRRLTRLARGRGRDIVDYAGRFFWTCESRLSLRDPQFEEKLKAALQGFTLCIIDSLSKLLGGLNENDNSAVSLPMGMLTQVSNATGCAILILHHEGKAPSDGTKRDANQRGRGASGIQSEWASQWVVDSNGSGQLMLEQGKTQHGDPCPPWSCRFVDEGPRDERTRESFALAISHTTEGGQEIDRKTFENTALGRAKTRILSVLGAEGPLTSGALMQKVGGNKDGAWEALRQLLQDRRVKKDGEGRSVRYSVVSPTSPQGSGRRWGNDSEEGS